MKTVISTIILPLLVILLVPNARGQVLGVNIDPPISALHVYENTANTGATAGLTVEQDGATGDAVVQYLLTGGQRWVMGIDNSDADKFKIAADADLNTTPYITITTAGDVGIGSTATAPKELLQVGEFNTQASKVHIEGNDGTGYAASVVFQDQTQASPAGELEIGYYDVDNSFRIELNDGESEQSRHHQKTFRQEVEQCGDGVPHYSPTYQDSPIDRSRSAGLVICWGRLIMSWFLFILLAVLTLGGGLGVVLTRNVVHAALALLLSLIAVAGVYLILFAEFLALVQVLIYGGAVIIVLLFAIMLTRGAEYPRISDNRQWPLAALAAMGLLGVLIPSFLINAVKDTNAQSPAFTELANSLFTRWAIPFEIASLVLLVALVGAIIIARSDRGSG